jgi:hypothetical protein
MKQTVFLLIGIALFLGVVGEIERRTFQPAATISYIQNPKDIDNGSDLWDRKVNLAKMILEWNPEIDPSDAIVYAARIVDLCEEYQEQHHIRIDWEIIARIIQVESRYRTDAVGKINHNDKGLGQINEKIHFSNLKDKGIVSKPADLFCPMKNIHATIDVYAQSLRLAGGDKYEAIIWYHDGKGKKVEYLMKVLEF